jgi:dolichol-phosphate mannosyltransferase
MTQSGEWTTGPAGRGDTRQPRGARKDRSDPILAHDHPTPVLSVVIPTYNERDALPLLVARMAEVRRSLSLELVIVDDASPDGTGAVADDAAKTSSIPITVVHRPQKTGLASAVLDGAAAARASVVTVMDSDLSHPPELLPALWQAIQNGADIAVASRYVPGGGVERWPPVRRLVSRVATFAARAGLGLRVRDPLSGFFAVRRELLTRYRYRGLGYKLLVEILATHPDRPVAEIPYRFVDRQRGKSKLGVGEILAFLRLLWYLRRRPS